MAVDNHCDGNVIVTGAMTTKNAHGSRHSAFLQKQMSFKSLVGLNQSSKTDELEVTESGQSNARCSGYNKNTALSWVCCAPCSWLQSSSAVHKIAITTATLLVTSLLVASPILFLISTAPSQLPRNCYTDDETCMSIVALPSDCEDHVCKIAASNIHSNLNWNSDPCVEFKTFSCGNNAKYQGLSAIRNLRSAQESVDIQMQHLLQRNTTFGPFRKLGRLFSSCLRQSTNSSTVRLVLDHLGGYLPIGAVGPSSISQLISKIYELGPTPIVDIYYDLSYGKRPHLLLIISGPNTLAPILESKIRLMGPKAPPYRVKQRLPSLLNDLLECFLPDDLTVEQKISEKESITTFINELNKKRVEYSRRGFWDSTVLYNISAMRERYPLLNWTSLLPSNWSGPIVVRSSEYLKAMEELLTKYPMRVVHNAMLVLFALGILPQGRSDPLVCTRATMWAMPYVSSALFMAQHSLDDVKSATMRTEAMFKSLKAHLKRAPSLKGAALVKLSALKIQSELWDGFLNMTSIFNALDSMDISSDNWMENVLTIYKSNRFVPDDISMNSQDTWAFPTVAKVFYDTLSHSIVVPPSIILMPYFDGHLPYYMQYASVGVAIAKEILRSITKSFDEKTMRCVPNSVNIFSNHSRMDVLIHSGGMQIAYHSMLSLTGSLRGVTKLPGLNLTPTQIFFLVTAQQLCAESNYSDIDTDTPEFKQILGWLIAQGGNAAGAFSCPAGSVINSQKTCIVL